MAKPQSSWTTSGGGGGGGKSSWLGSGGGGLTPYKPLAHDSGPLSGVRSAAGQVGGAISGFVGGVAHIGAGMGIDLKNDFTNPGAMTEHLFDNPFKASSYGDTETMQRLVRPTVQGIKHRWGPVLTEGDFSELKKDPIGAGLDILTLGLPLFGRGAAVLALGKDATAAEKAAALTSGRYLGPLKTIDVRTGKGTATQTVRVLPRTGHRAARMIVTNNLLTRLPVTTPVVGEYARAARALLEKNQRKILQHESKAAFQDYRIAYNRMNRWERVAFDVVNSLPMARDLEWYKGILPVADLTAQHTLALLHNPKIQELYDNPSEKMLAANRAGHGLDQAVSKIKIDRGWLSPIAAEYAPFTHTRIARGASYLSKQKAERHIKRIERQIAKLEQGKGRILREGKRAGRKPLIGTIAEARRLAKQAARSSKERFKLTSQAARVDELRAETEALNARRNRLMDTENGVYTEDIGLTPDMPAGPTTVGEAMAEALAKADPAVAPGSVRLYRGEGTGEVGNVPEWMRDSQGRWFTTNRRIAERYAREREGHVSYIDVPESSLAGYAVEGGSGGAEYILPRDLAEGRKALHLENQGAARAAAQGAIEDKRIQTLGEVHDALGEKLIEYEKALSAEADLHKAAIFGAMTAGKQAANKEAINAAREARIAALRAHRELFNELLVWQGELDKTAAHIKAASDTVFGGPRLKDLKREIADAGRPMPFYTPDVMAKKPTRFRRGGSQGLNPINAMEPVNTGRLFTTGRVAMHIDKLGPDFLRAVRNDAAADLHEDVLRIATPSRDGELASGFTWVRTKEQQYFPRERTIASEQRGSINRLFPDLFPKGYVSREGSLVHTNPEEIARNSRGQYMMIPNQIAKGLEKNMKEQRGAFAEVFNKIMDVWRALVLKVRIPWLISNVVGNTLLAGVKNAGEGGLDALLGAIQQTKGSRAVRRAIGMAEDNGFHLSDELMAKYLPEQRKAGTYLGTTTGESLPQWARNAHPVVKGSAMLVTKIINALPHIDKETESFMRRWTAERVLKGSDEVQAFYYRMPEETRSWQAAMEKGLKDENVRNMVSREVNDALGNFLSLTPVESNAIRNVFPFYAWFREILRITAKMPFDQPLKANILYRIGVIGNQIQNDTLGPLPTYLRGSIALGPPNGDLQNILALRSYNPWNSASDVVSGIGSLVPGGTPANANQLIGAMNPFISTASREIGSLTSPNQGVPKRSVNGLLYDIGRGVVTNLPEARVIRNPSSNIYPERDQLALLLEFLGYPKRTISRTKAQADAAQGK